MRFRLRALRRSAVATALVLAGGMACTSAVPVAALSPTASATVTSGVVTVTPPGIPGLLTLCAPVIWTYQGIGNAYLNVYLGGTFFVGPINVSMSVSGCENANGGAGSVNSGSITGTSVINGGTISCSFSGGGYTRQLVVFNLSVPTTCTTNGVTGTTFTLNLTGTWVPVSTTGQGVIAYIQDAALAAAVVSTG
jgi:hypothetical protein